MLSLRKILEDTRLRTVPDSEHPYWYKSSVSLLTVGSITHEKFLNDDDKELMHRHLADRLFTYLYGDIRAGFARLKYLARQEADSGGSKELNKLLENLSEMLNNGR